MFFIPREPSAVQLFHYQRKKPDHPEANCRISQFVRIFAETMGRRAKLSGPVIAFGSDVGVSGRHCGEAQKRKSENDKQQKPLHVLLQIRTWNSPWKFLHTSA